MQKIGEQASHLKEEIVAGKDHLVDVAGDAFDSVKSSLQNITHRKKAKAKKSAVKRAKHPAKKVIKKIAKKSPAKKPALKKSAKKAAKKK